MHTGKLVKCLIHETRDSSPDCPPHRRSPSYALPTPSKAPWVAHPAFLCNRLQCTQYADVIGQRQFLSAAYGVSGGTDRPGWHLNQGVVVRLSRIPLVTHLPWS